MTDVLKRLRAARASISLALATFVVLSGGCSASIQSGTSGPASSEGPQARKVLTVAITREPAHIEGFTGGSTTGGCAVICNLVHASLIRTLDTGERVPELAADVISTDKGNWQVNGDGSMVVTWRLRPDVVWHDGTPFTSADLLFSWRVVKDPQLTPPGTAPQVLDQMTAATTPDPQTFVVNWSAPYINADTFIGGRILPRHLLEDVHSKGDDDAFAANPFFTTQFVGLGPYRLTRWEQGSSIEATRFDGYFRGKAPLTTIFLRFIGDPNALVATIMADAADAVLPPGLTVETALEVQKRWEGSGNVVTFEPSPNNRILEAQHRPEFAKPSQGLPNVLVRQALYSALDRPALAQAATAGHAPIADSWVPPNSFYRPQLESSITKWPFDVAKAQQLLAQAGWKPGADGVLVHEQTGERFELVLRAAQVGGAQVGKDFELAVVGDYWKKVGVEPVLDVQFMGPTQSREYDGTRSGISNVGNLAFDNALKRMHTSVIASEANRWGGQNLSGYRNLEMDQLIDRYQVTIPITDRLNVERQLLQRMTGQVLTMPLYWEILPSLRLKGVSAQVRALGNDYFLWDKES